MQGNIFIGFSFSFVLNCLSSVSTGHWIFDFRTARQLNVTHNVTEERNGTSFLENLLENSTTSVNGSDNLFWTVPNMNETTEDSVLKPMVNKEMIVEEADDETVFLEEKGDVKEQEKEEATVQDSDFVETKPTETTDLHEKIVLQRMNCHLEIPVQGTHDLKIQIKFSQLQNNTSGKCCFTLNGPESSLLGILISNIHLYQNGSEGEVLQVITTNHGLPYILKEYHHGSEYQPLILTETHKAYLVLHYKVTTVPQDEEESHFNLELITYHKYENHDQKRVGGYSPVFSPIQGQTKLI